MLYITRVGANWFVSWSWLYPQHKHGKKREKLQKTNLKPFLNNKSCRATLVYIFFISCLCPWLTTVYVTIQTNQNLIKTNKKQPLCWLFRSQTMVNSRKTLKLLAWILRCAGFISWWVSLQFCNFLNHAKSSRITDIKTIYKISERFLAWYSDNPLKNLLWNV